MFFGLLLSFSASAQDFILKNGSNCPVEVQLFMYNTNTGLADASIFFTAPANTATPVPIPTNKRVCFILGDVGGGNGQIKVPGDHFEVPLIVSGLPDCQGNPFFGYDACFYFGSYEPPVSSNGSYYLAIAGHF